MKGRVIYQRMTDCDRICVEVGLMFCVEERLNSGFFFQADDGIRDTLWSRGLGDMYVRQLLSLISISQLLFIKSSYVRMLDLRILKLSLIHI